MQTASGWFARGNYKREGELRDIDLGYYLRRWALLEPLASLQSTIWFRRIPVSRLQRRFVLSGLLLLGGVMRTTAASATSLSLFPNPVPGGLLALGEVTLPQPAGYGGQTVNLTSSGPATAAVPAAVAVLPGGSSATFPILTSTVTSSTPVTISASRRAGRRRRHSGSFP
jgi:hypothetical protein